MTMNIFPTPESIREAKQAERDALIEQIKRDIPGVAQDKFNALASVYGTSEYSGHRYTRIEDVLSNFTDQEYIYIARMVVEGGPCAAGVFLRDTLFRICLKTATEEAEDRINEIEEGK